MQLFYDPRDDRYHEQLGSQLLCWLDDLGAVPLDEAEATSRLRGEKSQWRSDAVGGPLHAG